jgi:hypothetical protein
MNGADGNAQKIEALVDRGEVGHIPAYPIERLDNYDLEAPGVGVGKQAGQACAPVERAAGKGGVRVCRNDFQPLTSRVFPAQRFLVRDAPGILQF